MVYVEFNLTVHAQRVNTLVMIAHCVSKQPSLSNPMLTVFSDGEMWPLFSHALLGDLDQPRVFQRAMPHVSTKYVSLFGYD